jgi:8-oxo-dGTP pyrophosphatase MutT (NUDIX family)
MSDKGEKLRHKGQALPENFARQVPQGDSLERMVCDSCGFIAYENPKVVVGAVVSWQDKILLCRRAIDPRRGFWTIPAGYLELHERPDDGARREAREEACAEITIDQLLAVSQRGKRPWRRTSFPGRTSLGRIWPSPRFIGRSSILMRSATRQLFHLMPIRPGKAVTICRRRQAPIFPLIEQTRPSSSVTKRSCRSEFGTLRWGRPNLFEEPPG